MTFSIVAYDPIEQAWGVAVASKFLAAAAVVSWAQAGAGAVATQAFAKVSFGADGLKRMADGLSAEETLAALLGADSEADHRQVGMVDASGNAAAHTGAECFEYAGHFVGDHFTCQGNILVGRHVIEAIAATYQQFEGGFPERLLAALLAGDRAGGDKRGRQSAGLLIVKAGGGYGGDNDRMIDLRVDDHHDPIPRLQELLTMHRLYFGKSDVASRIPIDAAIARELQAVLRKQGHYTGEINGLWDEETQEGFWAFVGMENLEERWTPDDHPTLIDPVVLEFIRQRFGA
ncbi:MAG: DUF1028 domain-containing protein [Anaerolineae bacterium]